jgi:hypothetical protein
MRSQGPEETSTVIQVRDIGSSSQGDIGLATDLALEWHLPLSPRVLRDTTGVYSRPLSLALGPAQAWIHTAAVRFSRDLGKDAEAVPAPESLQPGGSGFQSCLHHILPVGS